jgi:dUTP pyrophosphatase
MQIIVVKWVILVNLSNETFVIQNGERAQLIIAKHERADWIEVQELSETQEEKVDSEVQE